MFAIGAQVLGADDRQLDPAGRLFAFGSTRRRRLALVPFPAGEMHQLAGHRFARALRPLTALARLAARDARQAPRVEPEATPARAAALLSHRLFGIVA